MGREKHRYGEVEGDVEVRLINYTEREAKEVMGYLRGLNREEFKEFLKSIGVKFGKKIENWWRS